MSEILLLASALLFAVLAAGAVGIVPVFTLGCLTALVVLPRALVSAEEIGFQEPLAVACVLVLIPLLAVVRPRTSMPWLFAPLAIFLVFMSLAGWSGPQLWGGTGDILQAAAAWGIGSMLASLHGDRERFDRWLAITLLAAVVAQALVTGLQTAGSDIFLASSSAAELTDGRASGTFGHPGNLGKAIILIVLLVLPLTRASDLMTSRVATMAAVLSIVPVGLSQSRSNFAALVGVLVLWAALTPRTMRRGPRVFVPLLVVAVSAILAGPVIDRFRQDPVGGARERLLDVALAHIPDNLWFGVGPNGYVPYFGRFDLLTSEGWPVHNAFLLLIAEIGLLGFLLLMVPIGARVISAAWRLRGASRRADWARATVVAVPAMLVLGVTGWGLASGSMLALWMLTFGYLTQRTLDRRILEVDVDQLAPSPATAGGRFPSRSVAARRTGISR